MARHLWVRAGARWWNVPFGNGPTFSSNGFHEPQPVPCRLNNEGAASRVPRAWRLHTCPNSGQSLGPSVQGQTNCLRNGQSKCVKNGKVPHVARRPMICSRDSMRQASLDREDFRLCALAEAVRQRYGRADASNRRGDRTYRDSDVSGDCVIRNGTSDTVAPCRRGDRRKALGRRYEKRLAPTSGRGGPTGSEPLTDR